MSELTDLQTGANRKLVAAQLNWATRPGAGQSAGFETDVDKIVAKVKVQMDNIHARDGTSVTSAKGALDTLAAAVKSGGPVVPDAA